MWLRPVRSPGSTIGCDARTIEVELRGARERLDLHVDRATGRATIEGKELGADDERALAGLATSIAEMLEDPAARRTRLRAVTVDDVPLDEHERPSVLIDRAFAVMAPQVRVIVERSRVPGELSLRRELGNDRREEIFVPYATLVEMVGQVPAGRRHHFDPLGIPGLAGAPSLPAGAAEASDPSISVTYDE